jgi:hypothetical protein
VVAPSCEGAGLTADNRVLLLLDIRAAQQHTASRIPSRTTVRFSLRGLGMWLPFGEFIAGYLRPADLLP